MTPPNTPLIYWIKSVEISEGSSWLEVRVGGCGLSLSTDVNLLQEIDNLKETNAESKQVEILELRQQVADSKAVKERSMSQWEWEIVYAM